MFLADAVPEANEVEAFTRPDRSQLRSLCAARRGHSGRDLGNSRSSGVAEAVIGVLANYATDDVTEAFRRLSIGWCAGVTIEEIKTDGLDRPPVLKARSGIFTREALWVHEDLARPVLRVACPRHNSMQSSPPLA